MTVGELIGVGNSAEVFAVADQPELALKLFRHPELVPPDLPERIRVFGEILGDDQLTFATRVGVPLNIAIRSPSVDEIVGVLMWRVFEDDKVVTLEYLINKNATALAVPRYALDFSVQLAAGVRFWHDRGAILGDLSSRNVLVGLEEGLIGWVDLDAYGFPDEGIPARLGVTDGYFRRSLLGADSGPTAWSDCFALGVHIITLLSLEALHPYGVDLASSGHGLTTQVRIDASLCWLSAPGDYLLPDDFPDHAAGWPQPLRELVERFTGSEFPPTADEWSHVLLELAPDDLLITERMVSRSADVARVEPTVARTEIASPREPSTRAPSDSPEMGASDGEAQVPATVGTSSADTATMLWYDWILLAAIGIGALGALGAAIYGIYRLVIWILSVT